MGFFWCVNTTSFIQKSQIFLLWFVRVFIVSRHCICMKFYPVSGEIEDGHFVGEPYEPYTFLEQMPPHPAFKFREELTRDERIAVAGYQDMGFLQHRWEVTPPDLAHPNCSVINSFLRFGWFRDSLPDDDYDVCLELISLLDSAIQKSVIREELAVIRGLSDTRWFNLFEEGSTFSDDAFGSFSLSPESACRYAGLNSNREKVFVLYKLRAGSHALYMGKKEEEMLLPRGMTYHVDEIDYVEPGILDSSYEAKVYMLVEG